AAEAARSQAAHPVRAGRGGRARDGGGRALVAGRRRPRRDFRRGLSGVHGRTVLFHRRRRSRRVRSRSRPAGRPVRRGVGSAAAVARHGLARPDLLRPHRDRGPTGSVCMNFDFSDEQNLLRDEVRRYLAQQSPLKAARAVLEGDEAAYAATVWRGLVELGATALMAPEDCGGSGLGALELCVVAEELGRRLAAVPFASTLYLAVQTILLGASAEQRRRWLVPATGGAIGAFAAPLDGVLEGAALPRFANGRLT